MKVITAPNSITEAIASGTKTIFLAGGIVNCDEWQDKLIEMLSPYDVILFNPRRKNYPWHDPTAAQEQIAWEFEAIRKADIFSMWFCDGPSDQPICMYEYGRAMGLNPSRVVVGAHPGYKRKQDVYIQTALIDKDKVISDSLEVHAQAIIKML